MLWVECGQLRERMGALFENIAVRYDCLSDHSTCSHFRFGSGVSLQLALDRSFMFAKALITCTACQVPGIGSTAVFGGTTCCMTGSDRGGHNDRSPRVAQFSLNQTVHLNRFS